MTKKSCRGQRANPRVRNSNPMINFVSRHRLKGVFAAVCMAAFPNLSHAQVSCTYAGGTNNWTTVAAWNTCSGFFPNNGNGGNNFNVTITGGLVTLDQDIALNNFTQKTRQNL